MSRIQPSREAIAWLEIGSTAIGKPLALMLSVFFLVVIFLVPLGQYFFDRHNGTGVSLTLPVSLASSSKESIFTMIDKRNNAILERIHELENGLEEGSLLRKVFLPPLQYVFLHFFGKGNEKAIPGRNHWLHYAPALDYLIGPPFLHPEQLRVRSAAHKLWERPLQPDPLAAIIDFNKQLANRGISLVVMPVPVKAAVHPEKLSTRTIHGPLSNKSWQTFVQAMHDNGIKIFDPRPVLSDYAKVHGDAYLSTDTHWSPRAMEAVAEKLAGLLTNEFGLPPGHAGLQAQPQPLSGRGDIARMLTLPSKVDLYPEQKVQIHQVYSGQQEFWQPDRNAQILLLGDSFTNIYSIEGLGWGSRGGFAEQLSHFLQTPLDLLARNDSGAYVTREMLAGELARGRDRLAGKKIVIWQFAERELAFGDWRLIALQRGEAKESGFYTAPADEKIPVRGVVAAVSRSARPGSVPYRDTILTLHLVDMEGLDRQLPMDQALVYAWGMRDNQLTRLAELRPGDSISLTLTSWEAVEGEYGTYCRSALDDQVLELELANWGTLTDEKKP